MSRLFLKDVSILLLRCAAAALILLATAAMPSAFAQSFTVIHTFTGQGDGFDPIGGLTLDSAGNLYGTTAGYFDPGTVFELKRSNGGWRLNTLYTFHGSDGCTPQGRVVFGPNRTLYGITTYGGGCDRGAGNVYNLRPPQTACKAALCPWTETVLHTFSGDGYQPQFVDPVFDQAGNLYGTTEFGGSTQGNVFELTPSGGTWTENVIHNFSGRPDGEFPQSGLILDNAGNLYATTLAGGLFGSGYGNGSVFQLVPSGSGWTENILYSFTGGSDGAIPYSGLTFDQSGNLYGTTFGGGTGGGGTVFELVPSGGSWAYNLIYALSGKGGPVGSLVMDAAGSLYGTTIADGTYAQGSVFKLTPTNGGWTYTDLHDFTGGDDGAYPYAGVTLDGNGNIYGTAAAGAQQGGNCYGWAGNGCGVVFEITP